MKFKLIMLLAFIMLMTSCTSNVSKTNNAPHPQISSASIDSDQTETDRLPFSNFQGVYVGDEQSSEFIKLIKNNPIDRDYMKEVPKSNFGEIEISNKYDMIWKKELSFTVNKLNKLLKGNDLLLFNESQKNWQNYSDKEYDLSYRMLLNSVGQGSEDPYLINTQDIERIRYRTFQLAEYVYMLSGNFTFTYKN